MHILVLNAGSSSQKARLYSIGSVIPDDAPEPRWEDKIEWTNDSISARVRTAGAQERELPLQSKSPGDALKVALETLWTTEDRLLDSAAAIDVVGHRIVHGGAQFTEATVVTPEVKKAIARLTPFAPLHNRLELNGIETITQLLRAVPQVAVFDTGFHRRLPLHAAVYPGPYEWFEQGIRRYGFHGINHQYCAERAARLLGRNLGELRIVTCHLGNGCSLAAIQGGVSIDTTMGFTPLDGLMMGTRSGSIDPGILTYLLREKKATGEELDELLNSKSGLLGISGRSSDMRWIVAAMKEGDERAKLAFDIYVHRLQACIASMTASLGGMDCLVFSAGIGENSAEVRAAACAPFSYMGVKLDAAKNVSADPDSDIASSDSAVRILVIRAEEDWMIARECWRLLQPQ